MKFPNIVGLNVKTLFDPENKDHVYLMHEVCQQKGLMFLKTLTPQYRIFGDVAQLKE